MFYLSLMISDGRSSGENLKWRKRTNAEDDTQAIFALSSRQKVLLGGGGVKKLRSRLFHRYFACAQETK